MIKKCIKIPFNEEITGKSGASVRFVDQRTVPLDTTVQAAVDGLFVIGQPQLVKNNFLGLFKSMAAGVQRDAKPRKIADFLRVYPVFTGAVDLDKGYDPKENGVYLAAELLNEMKLDISGWSFEDVTEGRKSIAIESITGSDIGVVDPTMGIELNGRGLSGTHAVELQLEGGEVVKVDPAHISGDVSRMDIAAEALAPFKKAFNDGKALTITVRGNFAKATKTATLKYAVEPGPHIESLKSRATRGEGEWRVFADVFDITGYGFDPDTTATLRLVKRATGQEAAKVNSQTSGYNVLKRESDEKLVFTIDRNSSDEPDGSWLDDVTYDAELVLTNAKGTTRLTLMRIED